MRSTPSIIGSTVVAIFLATVAQSREARIRVHADQVQHRLSRHLTGACIEDVNHEVYGGIDSQMIFGESFEEPAPAVDGFTVLGGHWLPENGEIQATGGEGPKLVSRQPAFGTGEVSVEIQFPDAQTGNAGLIVKVAESDEGADAFVGYEVSLDTSGQLVLGRHRHNWELLRNVPCRVPVDEWIRLTVRTTATSLEVRVNDQRITEYEDAEHPLETGGIGLRTWQRDARFRNLSVQVDGKRVSLPFEPADDVPAAVSGMWQPLERGTARGAFRLEDRNPFSGSQNQQVQFLSGDGEVGVANLGLNRWGMRFVRNQSYEGTVWVRATGPTELFVALESRDGKHVHAETALAVAGGEWQKLDFNLTPNADDPTGRFALKLKQPAVLAIGYAFLQPGDWGRFKGLPARRDIAEGLIDQGITVLRHGGCMANASEYRWKKMIGPRDRRPPYQGWWYPHASNGWGIFDFLNFCEAAGFLGIPDVNMGETPQDMADFMEYANGSAHTPWGGKRADDGHPEPYGLRILQLGNEERVDEDYWLKFKPMAEAIWAQDPDVILVVGDFAYQHSITNPFRFSGADSRITTLSAHQKILQLAKQHDREVWFDVHVWTDGPRPTSSLDGAISFLNALQQIAEGARFRVVIFELNADNPTQRRALANALAIQRFERDGRVPIVTSANCLQPDGQNDNGWNQGLLFFNPTGVWLQPPAYITQMIARHHQPLSVRSIAESPADVLDVSAKRSADGRTLVLQVVNVGDQEMPAEIVLDGFNPSQATATAEILSGPLDAANTADQPLRIAPQHSTWERGSVDGITRFQFSPHAFTILTFQ